MAPPTDELERALGEFARAARALGGALRAGEQRALLSALLAAHRRVVEEAGRALASEGTRAAALEADLDAAWGTVAGTSAVADGAAAENTEHCASVRSSTSELERVGRSAEALLAERDGLVRENESLVRAVQRANARADEAELAASELRKALEQPQRRKEDEQEPQRRFLDDVSASLLREAALVEAQAEAEALRAALDRAREALVREREAAEATAADLRRMADENIDLRAAARASEEGAAPPVAQAAAAEERIEQWTQENPLLRMGASSCSSSEGEYGDADFGSTGEAGGMRSGAEHAGEGALLVAEACDDEAPGGSAFDLVFAQAVRQHRASLTAVGLG